MGRVGRPILDSDFPSSATFLRIHLFVRVVGVGTARERDREREREMSKAAKQSKTKQSKERWCAETLHKAIKATGAGDVRV